MSASIADETPADWTSSRLDEIAEVKLGRQRSPKNHTGQLMRPYLRAANVTWQGLALDDVAEMNFTDAEMETFRLWDGDILVNEASGSPREVGKAAVFGGEIADCAFQNTLIRVRPHGVDTSFLHKHLQYLALTGAYLEDARGVGIFHLGRTKLAARTVPVPPLAEQHRIVEILEEHLSRLDAALESVRVVREKAAQFRRSLLHAAFTGALTGHQSMPVTSTTRVSEIPIPASWERTALDDLVQFSPKPPPDLLSSDPELSFMPMPSVTEVSGLIDLSSTIRATEGKRKNLTYFEDGDVIFAKITPCMENGKIARPMGLTNGAAYGSTEFHVMRPGSSVDGEFLRHFLVWDDFRYEAERAMTGAVGQRRVPRKYLQQFEIPLPPLDEQHQIVATIEDHLSRLDASLAAADRVEAQTAALRRSLLHAAFTGKLTESWRETQRV